MPQRINTIHSRVSERVWIILSVKFSHPIFACDAGSQERTVSTALSKSTPCSAQSVSSIFVRLTQISDSISLKIFRKLDCILESFGIENESPIAAPGV